MVELCHHLRIAKRKGLYCINMEYWLYLNWIIHVTLRWKFYLHSAFTLLGITSDKYYKSFTKELQCFAGSYSIEAKQDTFSYWIRRITWKFKSHTFICNLFPFQKYTTVNKLGKIIWKEKFHINICLIQIPKLHIIRITSRSDIYSVYTPGPTFQIIIRMSIVEQINQ